MSDHKERRDEVPRRWYAVISPQRDDMEWALILGMGVVLAVLLRFLLMEFESVDFRDYLGPWYQFIRTHDGFAALQHDFSNYAPVYLYLLVAIHALLPGLTDIAAVKLPAMCFDFLCAGFVYKFVRLTCPTGYAPLFAAFAILFAPTVVLNSAFWGQCDMVYTTGLVACLYYTATNRRIAAFIAYGLALSVKLQAIFLMPLLGILLMRRAVSWRLFSLIPIVHVCILLPASVAGRPFHELLLIYYRQTQQLNVLTVNAPNFWQWIPQDLPPPPPAELYALLYPAGIIWAFALSGILIVAVWKSNLRLTAENTVHLALLVVLSVPFFLPKMHERYFFAADVLSLVYAFMRPRYFSYALVINLASLFAYTRFLFGQPVFPLPYVALALLAMIVLLAHTLVKESLADGGGRA